MAERWLAAIPAFNDHVKEIIMEAMSLSYVVSAARAMADRIAEQFPEMMREAAASSRPASRRRSQSRSRCRTVDGSEASLWSCIRCHQVAP